MHAVKRVVLVGEDLKQGTLVGDRGDGARARFSFVKGQFDLFKIIFKYLFFKNK